MEYDGQRINQTAIEMLLCSDPIKKNELRDKLAKLSMPLTDYFVNKFNRSRDKQEAQSVANQTLVRAINEYCPKVLSCVDGSVIEYDKDDPLSLDNAKTMINNGSAKIETSFSWYLGTSIKQMIGRSFGATMFGFPLKGADTTKYKQGQKFVNEYENEHGRAPSVDLIAEEIGWPQTMCDIFFGATPRSIYDTIRSQDGGEISSEVASTDENILDLIVEEDAKSQQYAQYINDINYMCVGYRATMFYPAFDYQRTYNLIKMKKGFESFENFDIVVKKYGAIDDALLACAKNIYSLLKAKQIDLPMSPTEQREFEDYIRAQSKVIAHLPPLKNEIIACKEAGIFALCYNFMFSNVKTTMVDKDMDVLSLYEIGELFNTNRENVRITYKKCCLMLAAKEGKYKDRILAKAPEATRNFYMKYYAFWRNKSKKVYGYISRFGDSFPVKK